MSELARLLDRGALENDRGARAKLKIDLPAAWADAGTLVEITAPRTMTCARCDGGGCDGCGRSGALRGPPREWSRRVRLRLPQSLREGVALRLAQPFGPRSSIRQLWIEIRPAKRPSDNVRRILAGKREPRRILPRLVAGLSLLVGLVIVLLVVMTLLRR